VPSQFLLEYCDIKNQITKHVLENYDKPKNYDFLVELTKLITDINYQKLKIDCSRLREKYYSTSCRKFIKQINSLEPYCKYNIFGTKTGRLTTVPGSIPILTMAKEFRVVVEPTNDWFVEMDYNGAELRTVLSLSGCPQPKGDIHEWNAKNLYNHCTRDEAKSRIFAWLYNSKSDSKDAESVYKRSDIRNKYWDGECVRTPYDRIIKADKHHSMSYIIQSTFSDMLLRQMIKVNDFLKKYKSHIAFCVHDSIVLDMTEDEKHLIPQIKNLFSDTSLGNFKTNISAGRNFGKLYNLKI
jgi:DNA polymerase I-like protein with 3'-5' exonuclease and polymerase domains